MKPALHLLAAAAVTALALLYALWGVDFARLGALLAGADYRVLVPFAVLLVAFYVFTGLRWNLILRPQGRYTLAQSGPAMMIGFAGNNVLPAHLGELVRAVVFGRQQGLPASAVFVTQAAERLLDVFAILFLYALSAALIVPFPGGLRVGAEAVAVVVAVACAGIVVFLRFPLVFERVWERGTAWVPRVAPPLAPLRARGTALLHNTALGLAALKSPVTLAAMLGYSLLKWAACGGMVWLSLWAFGTVIPFSVSLVVVAVVALAVTVPTAPGFFGTMQAAFVFALTPFGVAHETALAASVLYLLAQWAPVTVFGAACFAATGLRLAEVRAEAVRVRG